MTDLKEIAKKVRIILLVDWPSRDIPRALIMSGFTVFSFSPVGYSRCLIEANPSGNLHQDKDNSASDGSKESGVIFHPTDHPPAYVDLVCIYRPPEEHSLIIRDHVIPLKAQFIWLQPPVQSMETQQMAKELGIIFVQGHDIREIISH